MKLLYLRNNISELPKEFIRLIPTFLVKMEWIFLNFTTFYKNHNCLLTIFLEAVFQHTIRKVKFLSKNSILTNPQHFHEFFTQIFFWQLFT